MRKLVTLTMAASLPLVLAACELAPKVSEQNGYRGTGMDHISLADGGAMPEVPAPPYDLPPPGGPLASETYENVQVLGNISADEFNYLMAAITEWVSPEQGCNYCHNPANMASDEVYTKVVARRMIQMTQNINEGWGDHVGQTGVTCWTCHAGNNIPENVWTLPEDDAHSGIIGNRNGQNAPALSTAYASLPEAAVARYLLTGETAESVRVQSANMHPGDNAANIMDTEATYSLMVHMSQALGINCTYCHNTQSFGDWSISTAPRSTAWYGIRMVGNINEEYVTPLTAEFPENRLGPAGDPYKVNCTTCHQGQNLPLGGVSMVGDYPALQGLTAAPAAEAEDTGTEATE